MTDAFGAPGIDPTWTSSAKDAVTTALGESRLWATIGFGIVNEVYWPATGQPQLRDLGFIVAGGGRWAEVKRVASYELSMPEPWIPLPRVVHAGEGYRLELEFLPDPRRDALLVRYRLDGDGMTLYPLLAPHLDGGGRGNDAWIAGGLFAQKGTQALCLLADSAFTRASAGYVGSSDGWQDFNQHGRMTWEFDRASSGNVALTAECSDGDGVLALAFAESVEGARTLAASSLAVGYDAIRAEFVARWDDWGRRLALPPCDEAHRRQAYVSATVLKAHEDRTFPGASVASLSIPWGQAHDDRGGYHLVWARDSVETGLAALALGHADAAHRMLSYLVATQSPDGHWAQNFYPDGRPYWSGVQLDETGFPIVLAAKMRELGEPETASVPPLVARAAAYLAQNGPVSPQDRWEENAGSSPFTVAVEVAALVAAAQWLDGDDRDYALALADCWNERIEEWCYFDGGALAPKYGVAGYYVRIGPAPLAGGLRAGRIRVANRDDEIVSADALVGLDFVYLARLGLRAPDDPRIVDTLKVVDGELRAETPSGPAYYRYEGDGYGEKEDGSPFDGQGKGRLWPLLAGERGHAALLAGEDPRPYLDAMQRMGGTGGLLPEQVWDAAPIPERNLFPGRPSGSAMPLVWAHSEFLKLVAAAAAGRPLEHLACVLDRWQRRRPEAATWFWRTDAPVTRLPRGRALVVEWTRPFSLHYGFDGWHAVADRVSSPLGLGMHGVRLEPAELGGHAQLDFTRFSETGWDTANYAVELDG